MTRRLLLGLVPAFAMMVLTAFEVWQNPDHDQASEILLDVVEQALIVASMVGIALAVRRLDGLDARHAALRDRVERSVAEGRAWRAARSAEIGALGDAIQAEFSAWGLSPAEADVAGLLLKGAAMKEIAVARDTSEATIRQQAQAVYRKSGLGGRVELQAYFLDSLFAEMDERRTGLRVVG